MTLIRVLCLWTNTTWGSLRSNLCGRTLEWWHKTRCPSNLCYMIIFAMENQRLPTRKYGRLSVSPNQMNLCKSFPTNWTRWRERGACNWVEANANVLVCQVLWLRTHSQPSLMRLLVPWIQEQNKTYKETWRIFSVVEQFSWFLAVFQRRVMQMRLLSGKNEKYAREEATTNYCTETASTPRYGAYKCSQFLSRILFDGSPQYFR